MDERDHSERQAVAWSTSEKSKNDVAYPVARAPHDPGIRRRSGISDSKYNDAAVLAIDLASATSWSDTVLPSAAHTQESDLVNTSMSIQHTHHSPDCRFSGQNHLGPPPEYTPSDERDLTPESGSSSINDMHEQPSQPEMSESTRLEDGLRESDQHPGPDAPLLDDFDEKAPEGRRQWMRKKGAESSPRRHLRGLRILIGLILLLSIIAAAFKYHRVCRTSLSTHNMTQLTLRRPIEKSTNSLETSPSSQPKKSTSNTRHTRISVAASNSATPSTSPQRQAASTSKSTLNPTHTQMTRFHSISPAVPAP